MKLYCTVTSERDGRIAKKGGDKQLNITLYRGNKEVGYITFSGDEVAIEVYNPKESYVRPLNGEPDVEAAEGVHCFSI